jgi:class 3 adenylate cyclase
VNIAQRMESVAVPDTIFVSQATYEKTINNFDYMDMGKISLKNVPSPMDTYKVMAKKELFKGL